MKEHWKDASFENMMFILKQIINGQTPEGYSLQQGSEMSYLILKYFKLTQKLKYVSLKDTIFVWEIKNTSSFTKFLNKGDLDFKNVNWIYLGKNCFKGKDKTLAVTSIRNEDKSNK